MIKKLSAFLIISAMLIPKTAVFADDINTIRDNAANALISMEIMSNLEDGMFHPEFNITRGEAAKLIYNLCNPFEYTMPYTQKSIRNYKDVEETGYEKAVEFAVSKGYMIGYSKTEFGVNDNIEYQQMLKVFIRILGYEAIAETRGGYPAGYISVARELELCDSISAAYNAPINRGTAALLAYRTVKAPMLEQEPNGEAVEYSKNEGETLWNRHYGIKYGKGFVTADMLTGLTSDKSAGTAKIDIDDERYLTGKCSYDFEWLGFKTEYFYSEDNTGNVLRYIAPYEKSKTDTIIIEAEDIEGYAGNTYKYLSKNEKIKTTNFEKSANIIYNGRFCGEMTDDMYIPENGYVKLSDTDNDGEYDLVRIVNYSTVIIDYYNYDENILMDKHDFTKNILLDPDKTDYIEIRDTDGKNTDISEIEEYEVLTVQISNDKKVICGTAAENTVTGIVTAYRENDDNDSYIAVDDKKYDFIKGFYSYDDMNRLIGKKVKLCLDFENRVAAVESTEDKDIAIAWIYETRMIDDTDGEPALMIKSFTQTGEFAKDVVKEPVTVDGIRYKEPEDAQNAFFDNGKKITPCLGVIKRNAEGTLKEIDTPLCNYEKEDEENSMKLLYSAYDENKQAVENLKLQYKSSTKSLGGRVTVSNDTIVFIVPSDTDTDVNSRNCYIKKGNYFSNDKKTAFEAYSTEESYGYAHAVIMYDAISETIENDTIGLALIGSVSQIYDEGLGEKTYRVEYLLDGGLKNDLCDTGIDMSGLHSGDVVRLIKDSEGRIINFKKYYDYNNDTIVNSTPGEYGSLNMNMIGYVYSKYNSYITVADDLSLLKTAESYSDISDKLRHYKGDSFRIYKYDSKEKENRLSIVSADGIQDYLHYGESLNKIFLATRYGDAKIIVVYN